MKTVTFITTGQPTTNPRLIKEAELLDSLGYKVNVIYAFYQNWATKFDSEITGRSSVKYILCGGDPLNMKAIYWVSRVRQKLALKLYGIFRRSYIAENAISRTHAEALALAKKIKSDVYIAHNLGALPAAVIAAKANGAKVGYDAEDMHSAQFNSFANKGYLLNKYIEEKYFPLVDSFTAASPLIAANYQQVYPYLRPLIVNNVFPSREVPTRQPKSKTSPLKLFWFSQTIGGDRGLEEVIVAMGLMNKDIELHLLGSCTSNYRETLYSLAQANNLAADRIHIHEPMSPGKLLAFTAHFDIGLATETGITLNRDICLTNKIFTYLQCGLPIIASDTQAQQQFINTYPKSGMCYPKGNATALMAAVDTFESNRELLEQCSHYNYQLGQTTLNWDNESRAFLSAFNSHLK
ncbi:glycosyltransferase family 4 protein [Mucilaginibacter pallidiroseus]|uniref:Glycosyltransferase family 4 protein n=1 Tax=Mucilaginibacter pallidiroseus TaxID=2599295 RepID=A0A563U0Q6_9SPHI|nr:glycosyltransferase [Mucilaginibacter pallidiroseus]TWR25196.1 glycosyltransferase family 4 protein [Mucilaginibacter pallidiroseus]